jgi:outer membrane murein-binding lipoprotein Lpp
MKHKRLILCAVLFLGIGVTGCKTITPDQLANIKATAQTLNSEVNNLRSDFDLMDDPVTRAMAKAQLDEIAPYVTQINDTVQDATTGGELGWELLYTGLTVLAGFVPGAGIMIPLVNSARRVTKSLIASVDAGGGVSNPEVARASLDMDPKARKFYDANKKGT